MNSAGALRCNLLPGRRGERAAAVGNALQQGHHGVDVLLYSRKGDVEIFVVADRPLFPWPALVGAELEPFTLAGDVQNKNFRGPCDHSGAAQQHGLLKRAALVPGYFIEFDRRGFALHLRGAQEATGD